MSPADAKGAQMWKSSLRIATGVTVAILSVAGAKAQTPMVASTKDFITAAAQSDHFEIVEGQTALTQTHDPRIRAFAQHMIQAHIRTSQALQAAAVKAGMATLPSGLSGDQQKLLGALQSQRGSEFDHTYLKQQALAHRVALVVEQAYAAQGEDREVRQVARSAVPVIQRHSEMVQQLRSEIGGA